MEVGGERREGEGRNTRQHATSWKRRLQQSDLAFVRKSTMGTNIALRSVLFVVLVSSAWTESGGNPQLEEERHRDVEALNQALLKSGGPPGKVPAQIFRVQNPKPTTDPNCTKWAYEYTNVLPDGLVRHEHAVIRYQGTNHEVLDIRGLYAKAGGRDGKSFIVYYHKQGGNETKHTLSVNCETEEWGVLKCFVDCLKSDLVVHGIQEPSCREAGALPLTTLGNTTLEDVVGVRWLPKYKVPDFFNSSLLLEYFGGPPGNFSPTYNQTNFQPPPEPKDPKQRPLPDAPRESWLYNHWEYYLPSAIRVEHAAVRFAGKPNQFLDARGLLYWRSNVGDFRIEYRQDDTGFHSYVDATDCFITRGLWWCGYPKSAERKGSACGSYIPYGLLASLVG